MDEIIDKIVQKNSSLFSNNPKINKIDIGLIHNIDSLHIIKICTNENNEDN